MNDFRALVFFANLVLAHVDADLVDQMMVLRCRQLVIFARLRHLSRREKHRVLVRS